jgi:multisubunit Na+/H+ antiporter MnhB subunit
MSTLIFRTASELLVPISLLFAVFIFYKGHQTPGGGFVGGLVLAMALIVQGMATGRERLRQMVRFRERTLVAVGLLLALGAGLGSMLLGRPFLTSAFGYVMLPGANEKTEWATVMVFDLGVVLVVAGVVVGMINALAEELE